MIRRLCHLLGLLAPITLSLCAYDNAHFYRATNLFFESRIDRNYLTSGDIFLQTGATSRAWNRDHQTVHLFDIYGTHDMHELGIGVPGKDLSNPFDLLLTQLSLIPSRCTTSFDACKKNSHFATYSISGEFTIIEGILSFIQNIKRGFFVHVHIPFRRLNFDHTCFCDISPTTDPCPNSSTPLWNAFKDNFDAILARYGLTRSTHPKTTIGDITALIGWTNSFQETEILDFIDTTFKAGILFPSGDEKNEDLVFSFPSGYNRHVGATIHADCAIGALDWFTFGAHIDVLAFANKTRLIRLKTGPYQSGLIKLAKDKAKEELGSLWQMGVFIKADHVLRGLSLLFGYSFVNKNRDILIPCDAEKYPPSIINSDEALFGWNMHTITAWLEYDFAKQSSIFGPRISLYYNRPISGKRILRTDMVGGNIGLDIAWNF